MCLCVCLFEVKCLLGRVNSVVYHWVPDCNSCAWELLNDTFGYSVSAIAIGLMQCCATIMSLTNQLH